MAKRAMKEEPKFNLSQAIRSVLEKNKKFTAAECIKMVKKANPGQSFNENTAAATWSKLRRDMGVSRKRRSTSKRVVKTQKGKRPTGGTSTIRAAAELVRSAGSIAAAREALNDLERAIQIVQATGVPF
jgi:hypothetical protein